MTRIVLAALALVTVLVTLSEAAVTRYRWVYRPLFVFAKDADSAALAEQRRILQANRSGFSERDIVVVFVTGNSVSAELGPSPGEWAADLRNRYGAENAAFKAVLVGKDGGAKLSSTEPISAAKLFSTIDAMPMRRDEMRR